MFVSRLFESDNSQLGRLGSRMVWAESTTHAMHVRKFEPLVLVVLIINRILKVFFFNSDYNNQIVLILYKTITNIYNHTITHIYIRHYYLHSCETNSPATRL